MAIGIYFAAPSFSVEQYDTTLAQLEEAGAGAPEGRLYHCAFMAGPTGIHVFDVWESQETFDAFGQTLMPILTDAGVDVGTPMITPVHNTILG